MDESHLPVHHFLELFSVDCWQKLPGGVCDACWLQRAPRLLHFAFREERLQIIDLIAPLTVFSQHLAEGGGGAEVKSFELLSIQSLQLLEPRFHSTRGPSRHGSIKGSIGRS